MKEFAQDISYRLVYFLLAVALIYFMPTLLSLFTEFATAVMLPLFENALQNMGSQGAVL